MARFPKSEMLNELRTIFLFEADHILMGSGPEVAAQFIGFDPSSTNIAIFRPKELTSLNSASPAHSSVVTTMPFGQAC